MAEVFLARSVGAMGFHRLVAVKLIHANFTRDPEFVKMFIDEATNKVGGFVAVPRARTETALNALWGQPHDCYEGYTLNA